MYFIYNLLFFNSCVSNQFKSPILTPFQIRFNLKKKKQNVVWLLNIRIRIIEFCAFKHENECMKKKRKKLFLSWIYSATYRTIFSQLAFSIWLIKYSIKEPNTLYWPNIHFNPSFYYFFKLFLFIKVHSFYLFLFSTWEILILILHTMIPKQEQWEIIHTRLLD